MTFDMGTSTTARERYLAAATGEREDRARKLSEDVLRAENVDPKLQENSEPARRMVSAALM